jgi:CBS domain containing-hemolysin-like protein
MQDLDQSIAATQLGITIASIGLGWIGERTLAHLFEPVFAFLPLAFAGVAMHSLAVSVAFFLVTFLHVVLGELIPKSLALQYPERTALGVANPMQVAVYLFRPLIWILNGTGNRILRLFGVTRVEGHHLVHSPEELELLIRASHAGGVLDDVELKLLHKVLKFSDLVARQVMIPRRDMVALSVETTLGELWELLAETPHTRFPVYEESVDHIIGVLHIKDLLPSRITGEEFSLRQVIRRVPPHVPETLPISQILSVFQQQKTQMAMVVDEFGGITGLVTLEDIMEEIVGELYDEFDRHEEDIVVEPSEEISLHARVRLDELEERFGLSLSAEAADTVGGYVLAQLGRIARVSDRIAFPGGQLQVIATEGPRIQRLKLILDTVQQPLAASEGRTDLIQEEPSAIGESKQS